MPRQPRYLVQTLPRKGAPWRTVEKLRDERSAIHAGDVIARKTDVWEIRVMHGATRIEHWLLRDKEETCRK